MGIRKSMDKRRAICLRLTPHTTAREQANRITLLLIGWEVENPLDFRVQYPRWFLVVQGRTLSDHETDT